MKCYLSPLFLHVLRADGDRLGSRSGRVGEVPFAIDSRESKGDGSELGGDIVNGGGGSSKDRLFHRRLKKMDKVFICREGKMVEVSANAAAAFEDKGEHVVTETVASTPEEVCSNCTDPNECMVYGRMSGDETEVVSMDCMIGDPPTKDLEVIGNCSQFVSPEEPEEICFSYSGDPAGSDVTQQCDEAYDANITEARCCTGSFACYEFVGTVCVRGTEGSCNGPFSCLRAGSYLSINPVNISSGSCNSDNACNSLSGSNVASGSCNDGNSACQYSSVSFIGEGSCNNYMACAYASGVSIGSSSCTEEYACLYSSASILDDGICSAPYSCLHATDASIGSSICSTECCECSTATTDAAPWDTRSWCNPAASGYRCTP